MIDIRYIEISCDENQNINQVTTSDEPIEIQKRSDGLFIETIVFPKIYHYLGFCISDEEVTETPYFQLTNGKKEELFPIKVPGKKVTWWIQNSGWDAINNRFYSEIFRTVGRYKLFIQNQVIEIENESFDLSLQDLEYYLNDFKNGLWNLILNHSSAASAYMSSGNGTINNTFLDLISNFIDHTYKIIANPSAELHEIQANKPIRSVKPIPATFRELALRPNRKNVISRSFTESYNTTENRFIHYCVNRIYFLLKSLQRISEAQNQQLQHKIIQENKYLSQLQLMTHKIIDPIVYDNEIKKLENDLSVLNQKIALMKNNLILGAYPAFSNTKEQIPGKCIIQLSTKHAHNQNQFFCQKFNHVNPQEQFSSYMVIEFPDELIYNLDLEYTTLRIYGTFTKSQKTNSKGNLYWYIQICATESIEILAHPDLYLKEKLHNKLKTLKNNRFTLEKNHWVEELTRDEEKDRDMEISMSNKKLSLYQNLEKNIEQDTEHFTNNLKQLKTCVRFFTSNKIAKQSENNNSMIFVQNPNYAGVKSLFKKILQLQSLDESILEGLSKIDSLGLVNISLLYERWCLVQIITVLHEKYNFQLKNKWQHILIQAVLNKQYNIEIFMHSEDKQQDIILTYEKVLDSGKRPDFVIDLTTKNYVYDHNTNMWSYNNDKVCRLVLDAKFKRFYTPQDIEALVLDLYQNKNYSENNTNKVFILQPNNNLIKSERTSPLDWGKDNDYGHSNKRNHKYGHIYLSPSRQALHSKDNLQRLIGLFLQENSSILLNENNDDHPTSIAWSNICCISCGNHNPEKLTILYSPTQAGNNRFIITCAECNLRTIKTLCYNCRNPLLFKNGFKWTYHRTRAEQTSNIVCPACESFL
ncbi:DUF2357 domain-containing protein [Wohlfahrtiimonas chitiniclastica]|uniref:DUF2357 domain-containing protein n=1 Tax=Wohlfahrtiimonas chitiniclastica TaxID=400946 RepID=UPI001BCFBC40|nr:DUF2357 domain-containing protein [Wohlfahrtiimonas chitiniclastica]MBS7836446.1 DUF2357 domain-containing protein [Wohlfahrtiimonas chitiniclastica]